MISKTYSITQKFILNENKTSSLKTVVLNIISDLLKLLLNFLSCDLNRALRLNVNKTAGIMERAQMT